MKTDPCARTGRESVPARTRARWAPWALLGSCALLVLAVLLLGTPRCSSCAEPAEGPTQGKPDMTLWVQRPAVRLRAMASGGGEGTPVLFIHGLAGNMEVWSRTMAHQGGARRAGAFDLRGHGSSGVPKDGTFSIVSMAEDAAAVAEALGFRRYVLVGHSLGGAVVAACAGRHPERVAGVLFLDPPNRPADLSQAKGDRLLKSASQTAYRDQMNKWWSSALQDFPASRDRVLATLARTPPQSIGGSLAGLGVYDPLPDLTRARVPLLSLTLPGADNPRSYHALVPSIRHEVIEGASHWIMLDAPDEFDRRLDAFLSRVDQLERSHEQ